MKIGGRYFNIILSKRKKPIYTQREAFIVKVLKEVLGLKPKEVSWYQRGFFFEDSFQ